MNAESINSKECAVLPHLTAAGVQPPGDAGKITSPDRLVDQASDARDDKSDVEEVMHAGFGLCDLGE